ncbi:MAG: type I methionyl aminopeptidase [Planctomyces sp.]|nr:type I methionyl aminopeptidase [Planctomyces sp.]
MITLKSARELGLMREAGRLVAESHAIAREMIRPGTVTGDIDSAIDAFLARQGATPLFKGFPGPVPFPASTCISVNQQIVHGVPGAWTLKEGDIVSLDVGVRLNGWCGDAAWTYAVGEVDDEKRKLMAAGRHLLHRAAHLCGQKQLWSQVATEMMRDAKKLGVSLVRRFVGHGIGREMHEEPQVPNFFDASMNLPDFSLNPGLVLAIEPMVNAGKPDVRILHDKWTAVTADGRPSVHYEHTVAITKDGPVLLTEGVGEPFDPREAPALPL